MNRFLPILQSVFELTPVRGKGRMADLLLKNRGEITCHPLPGLTVYLDSKQRIERLMWAGAYERGLVKTLKSALKPGMVFLDVGANIGYFSAIAASLIGPRGRVFSFEPSPACFPRLCRNLSAFEQAKISACAVGEINGPASLYVHPTESGWGSLFYDPELSQRFAVHSIRLDDWAREACLERLDFMKMDIEGGEYGALLGARNVLRLFRPVVVAELNAVCLARNRHTPDDLLRLLSEEGYECRRTGDSVYATPSPLRISE